MQRCAEHMRVANYPSAALSSWLGSAIGGCSSRQDYSAAACCWHAHCWHLYDGTTATPARRCFEHGRRRTPAFSSAYEDWRGNASRTTADLQLPARCVVVIEAVVSSREPCDCDRRAQRHNLPLVPAFYSRQPVLTLTWRSCKHEQQRTLPRQVK